MPGSTTINGFRTPLLADPALIEQAVGNFADDIDKVVIPRFTTPTARDVAIPSPVFGQFAACSSTGELYYYTGSGWAGARPRIILKTQNQNLTANTTLQNDQQLWCSVEANSIYRFWLSVAFSSPLAADFKYRFTLPTGATGQNVTVQTLDSVGVYGCWSEAAVTDTLIYAIGGGFGDFSAYRSSGSIITTTDSGLFRWQWAQNTSSGTTTVLRNSFFKIQKLK